MYCLEFSANREENVNVEKLHKYANLISVSWMIFAEGLRTVKNISFLVFFKVKLEKKERKYVAKLGIV